MKVADCVVVVVVVVEVVVDFVVDVYVVIVVVVAAWCCPDFFSVWPEKKCQTNGSEGSLNQFFFAFSNGHWKEKEEMINRI